MSSFVPWLFVAAVAACGCDVRTLPNELAARQRLLPPHLEALSTYSAGLGTTVLGYGTGFPVNRADGELQLAFLGEFERADGRKTRTDSVVGVRMRAGSELVWDQLGPYGHPFTQRGDELGTFRGTVGVRWITPDHLTLDDPEPLAVTFAIKPSIVVRRFTPLTARCEGPVRRAFGGLPYDLTVEAVGFVPRSFTYVVSAVDAGYEGDAVRNEVIDGATDSVVIVPPAVPLGARGYALVVRVRATDAGDRLLETTFAVGVHQPVEVTYGARPEVAEVYAPQVVSGCMHGGLTGRTVTYFERMAQTLERSTTYQWNQTWINSHSISASTSESVTTGISFKTGRDLTVSRRQDMANGWHLTNGFSVTMRDARTGHWSVETDTKDATSESTGMLESSNVKKGPAVPFSAICPYGPHATVFQVKPGTKVDPATLSYERVGPVASFTCLAYSLDLSTTIGFEDVTKQEDETSNKTARSVDEQAAAALSKRLLSETSLEGSEHTTDARSVTSSERQTATASATQKASSGTVQTTQSTTGTGADETNTVSSVNAIDTSFRGVILAGHYGVFYRQAMRLVSKGSIVAYDQCGAGEVVGDVSGSTYAWSPDLAQGPQCNPLPPSALPPYACLISPCTGNPR
jgi:hypothetical protein